MSQDRHREHTFNSVPSEFLNMEVWRVYVFETSNVVNIPQKEAGLRYLFRSVYL
ncbi:hypothetical protein Taro_034901 [Colocasia esculenta]|uniref:Uncharacterized protein n=1 Tax=Colocasia esculenta TaxID=4460 RepID=A0A843W572_COLES|nr:hypothetical protein [Colocasia esculenta]